MANINTINSKNTVELKKIINGNGVTMEHIVINGIDCGIMGSANEKDRQEAIKTIQEALDASNGDIMEMIQKLSQVAHLDENKIVADEEVIVNEVSYIISYDNKTAYDLNGEEVVNINDLPDMPEEAIKAVLIERLKNC